MYLSVFTVAWGRFETGEGTAGSFLFASDLNVNSPKPAWPASFRVASARLLVENATGDYIPCFQSFLPWPSWPAAKGAPSMASSSPNRRKLIEEVGRSAEVCNSCLKMRRNIGDVKFSRCSSCRSAFYCSAACQLSDWKDHKEVCKIRTKALADLRAAAPGPNFVADFEQWARSSQILGQLNAIMLQEAAAAVSRPGAPVTAEDLTRDFCAVLTADYKPDGRLPFRIRDNYGLVSFDSLEGPDWGRPETAKEMRESKPVAEGGGIDHDAVVLNMMINVGFLSREILTQGPREFVNGTEAKIPGSVPLTAAQLVSVINGGWGGTFTTKSSRRKRG